MEEVQGERVSLEAQQLQLLEDMKAAEGLLQRLKVRM